jgi:2-methylisocitrate lyase-like PEP mutase family enzyme
VAAHAPGPPVSVRQLRPERSSLRALLAAPGLVVAPGAYDVLTARLVEHAGFPAVYMTGSGVSISALGFPDIGYKVVIYPNSLTRIMARAGQRVLDELKRAGTTSGLAADMLTHGELWDLFGRREWERLEAKFVTGKEL